MNQYITIKLEVKVNKYSALIITGAAFWGTMGIFSRTVEQLGFTTVEAAAMRMIWAALILAVIMLIKDRHIFRISLRDLPLLAATGIISVFAMSVFYLSAISSSSLSVAAILLYTAPFFVTVASAVIYREKITVKTACALVLAFLGCVFIAGIGGRVTPLGLFYGLMAGITYASYSILGKKALVKYSPYTVTLWAFIFAAVSAFFVINPAAVLRKITESGLQSIAVTMLMGLVTAVVPFLLYTLGLKYTDAGKASIMATTEPMVATVAGMIVFHEIPGFVSFAGIFIVIFAIALLNNFGISAKKQHCD